MRFHRRGAASLIFLLVTSAASATTWYLPGAAEAPGANGAIFSSTLFLTNTTAAVLPITVNFIPVDGKTAPPVVGINIPAGKIVKTEHVLRALFGLTEDIGTITVTSATPLILSMVTANIANPNGSFGLGIDPVSDKELIAVNGIGHALWATHSIDFSKSYRTNVGAVLVDPNSEVKITVFDDQGVMRGSTTVSSRLPSSFQTSLSTIIGNTDLAVGRVEFRTQQGRTTGYTSVVDNITSDAIAVQTREVVSGETDILLNGAARTPGVNNSHWQTDIQLFNPSTFPFQVSIYALGFNVAGKSITRVLAPRETLAIPDVLGPDGLNFGEGAAGALRITSQAPFLVAGRTSNSDPTGVKPGTFSGYQKAGPFSPLMFTLGSTAVLSGLEQSAQFRTNVGFLSGSGGATLDLTLRDSLGAVALTKTIVLEGGVWRQNALPDLFGKAAPTLSRLEIQVVSGSIDTYASKIDNGTGDPVLIPAVPLPVVPAPTSERTQ
ncbi:MAG: hypothetical protein ABI718_15540 [Acidobacteriota bacterium]